MTRDPSTLWEIFRKEAEHGHRAIDGGARVKARKPGAPIPLELQTATRHSDGKGFVTLTVGTEMIMMDPGEARNLGNLFIDYAGIAETEAATVQVINRLRLQGSDELPDARDFVSDVTAARDRIRRECQVH